MARTNEHSKGNSFWELRSKHGKDRIFSTPEIMWEAACEYFQYITDNPFYKTEAKVVNIGDYQSEIKKIELPVMKPFTMQGLCRYLGVNTVYFNQFEMSIEGKKDEISLGYSKIITQIREVIFEQKYSGAAAGFFNSNLIARDLKISDSVKTEHSVNSDSVKEVFKFGDKEIVFGNSNEG